MKSFTQYVFLGLAFLFFFTSCTMEKRVYRPGYYTEWLKGNQVSKKNIVARKVDLKIKKHTENEIVLNNKPPLEYLCENKIIDTAPFIAASNSSASVDEFVINPSKDKTSIVAQNKQVFVKNPSPPVTEITSRKALRAQLKKLKNSTTSLGEGDSGVGVLSILGWVFMSLGLLILLFASILIGALLMILGLVFVLVGGKKKGSTSQSKNREANSQYIDVVYLKNGSIIKGMIIEQTPNVSLKIQTRDGSVFVYKMDEVEKMTKELSK